MRALLIVLLTLFTAGPATAGEERPLSGAEIEAAITDRTAIYDDGATQYFSSAGWSDYVTKGGPPDRGKWEVRGDQYCSWWERGGWSCYDVTGTVADGGDRITWIAPSRGTTYPGRMVDGNQTN